jgi:hypothetical protein
MFTKHSAANSAKLVLVSAIILGGISATGACAQSANADQQSHQQLQRSQSLTTQPLAESPPDLNRPPRIIHRTGTAIGAPRNSISIKSTDAGIIHRQSSASGCINCGIINFVNKIGRDGNLNAIASGVAAGTIAREIIRQTPHPHGADHHGAGGGIHGHYGANTTHPGDRYHIGITMNDGRQAIIALPDAADFHQGDSVKLIDGVLVLDRP